MKARTKRVALMLPWLLSAALAACTGSVGTTAGGGNLTGGPSSGGSAGNGGAGSSGGTAGAAGHGGSGITGDPAAESAGPMVMRRLTYREYDHIMAQLLGDTTAPASGADPWSPDAAAETGFVSPSTVASYHVIQYNQTADALVDTAVQAVSAGKSAGQFVIPCKSPAATAEAACAKDFITSFGLHAYRRPVSDVEAIDLSTVFSTSRTTGALGFNEAIGAVAKAMLQSPNFLYHWELGPNKPVVGADGLVALAPWQVAARLATSLWESMPDDNLLAAAQKGELSTREQVVAQAQRMLADPKATQSLYSFHLQWMFNMGFHVTDLSTIVAKPNSPLTAAAAAGLQTEFTQFITSVYGPDGDGTLNTLYTAPYAFVNQDLAAIYGVSGPATGFAKVNLDPKQRAGIFTQVAFLAGIEDSVSDNPIYRGLAIYLKALCGSIGSPPNNVPTVNFKAGGTTRQAYDLHGSSQCANACHSVFDPPGFAFENYDGAGAFRTMDGTSAVDSSGTFLSPQALEDPSTGTTFKFNNAVELVKQLAASPEAQQCIERQWSRYMLGRMEEAGDKGSLDAAYRAGAAQAGFSIRETLVSLVSSKAFMYRQPSAGEPL